MGELAEALRRANDEADRASRANRSPGAGAEAAARTLSLDEVLGRSRSEAVSSPAAGPASDPDGSAVESDPAAPRRVTRTDGARSDARNEESAAAVQSLSRDDEAGYRAQRIGIHDEATAGSAAARRLAQMVKRKLSARGIRSLAVTSALRGEGKTTTACNLAIALTRLDRSESVVLVDLDLRRPTIARSLGITPLHTVNEVLERRATLDEALVTTDVPGLFVLGTTRGTPAPEALLASHRLRDLIQLLERRFSRLVIDTPPALVVSDASAVIEAIGGFLFVASSGNTPTRSIQGALDHLPREKMIGCVLNFARESTSLPTEYYYAEKKSQAAASGEPARTGAEAVR